MFLWLTTGVIPAATAQEAETVQLFFFKAEVAKTVEKTYKLEGLPPQRAQEVTAALLSGPRAGGSVKFTHPLGNDGGADELAPLETGDKIVLSYSDENGYLYYDIYRLPRIGWMIGLFLSTFIVVVGPRSVGPLAGLLVSFFIILGGVGPAVINGTPPLLSALVGALLIGTLTLYLAHGVNRRTTVALSGLLLTLLIATLFSSFFVWLLNLGGTGGYSGMFVEFGILKDVDMQGLFLGAVLLGTLGVLDDVTTAQTAVVEEISRADPQLGFWGLYHRALAVGREHVTSLINALALAYAGAAMPLLLLTLYDPATPWWVAVNGQFIQEEILRTMTGSMALICAVPLTSALAARFLSWQNNSLGTRINRHIG
jgi:uncharacterized membrane protein